MPVGTGRYGRHC